MYARAAVDDAGQSSPRPPNRCFRNAEQVQAEAQEPFWVHVVNDDVGDLLGVFETLRLAPMPQLRHNAFNHRVEIDTFQRPAPLLGNFTLNLHKLPLRPAVEGFGLRALPEDEPLLIAELDRLPAGKHHAAVNLA